MLRLWIIGDIMRSFQGIDFLPSKIYLFVGVAGATMGLASAYYCFHSPGKLPEQWINLAFMLNQCVNVGWSTFCIAILAAIKLINLGWNPSGAKVTVAIVMRIVGDLLVGEMFTSHFRIIRVLGNCFDSIMTIGVCLMLTWLFINPLADDRSRVEDPASEMVRRSAAMLLAFGKKREG
jgi:hypothetical protein